MEEQTQNEITQKGNPRKPQGEEGRLMLNRMSESHAPLTEWALSRIKFNETDTVLDIGCGGGTALLRLSKCILSGKLVGVDYSPISVALAQENNAADIAGGKTKILLASVENLPFANGAFDRIITVESFYFWPNPAENLREVLRVLKPGGIFLLIADIYKKNGLTKESLENIERYQMNNFTKNEFEAMFRRTGFSEVRVHTKNDTDWICVEGVKPF